MIDLDLIHRATPPPLALAGLLGLEAARGSTGSRVRVRCPWHAERNPSCSLSERDGRVVAHCFSCGEGGDVFALVAAVEGLSARRDFPEVARRTAELLGVNVERDEHAPPRRQPDPAVMLAQAIEGAAADWLAGRAIGRADAERIEAATADQIGEACTILHELDRLHAERDDKLDRLAEAHDERFYGALGSLAVAQEGSAA